MRVVVHIGMGKAGSTSLQAALAAFRNQLQENGIAYPLVPDDPICHHGMRRCFEPSFLPRTAKEKQPLSRKDYLHALDVAISQSNADTVILSSELLFNLPPTGIAEFYEYLQSKFEEVEVIAYVREHVGYYLSFQQQIVKASGRITPPNKFESSIRLSIERYAKFFGPRLKVRSVDRRALVGGSVVEDFLHLFFPSSGLNIEAPDKNESLSAEAMCVLQWVRRNAWPDEDNVFDGATRKIIRVLQQIQNDHGGQTKPTLKPDVHDFLWNRFTDERLWLADQFGIEFPTYQVKGVEASTAIKSASLREILLVEPKNIAVTAGLLVRRLAEM